MEKISEFRNRLNDYDLSEESKKQYLYYYKKLRDVVIQCEEKELTEEIANAFLKLYKNSTCHAFLNNYIRWNKLNMNLEAKVVRRKPQKSKKYITPPEIKKLGNWLKQHYGFKYKLLLYITYHCALRRKEALGLDINYLKRDFKDWDKKSSLRITIKKETAKREKEGKVILPYYLAESLRRYIIQNKEKILSTSHKNNIFRIGKSRWQDVYKNGVRKCLNEDYTLHELRFSKATYWWSVEGFDIVTIQKLLRHKDITATQRYIDPAQETALQRLEESYGND